MTFHVNSQVMDLGMKLFTQFAFMRYFSFPSLVPVSIVNSFVSNQFTLLCVVIVAKWTYKRLFSSVSCLMLFVFTLWELEKCISRHCWIVYSIGDVYFSMYFWNRGICIFLCTLSAKCKSQRFWPTENCVFLYLVEKCNSWGVKKCVILCLVKKCKSRGVENYAFQTEKCVILWSLLMVMPQKSMRDE